MFLVALLLLDEGLHAADFGFYFSIAVAPSAVVVVVLVLVVKKKYWL